MRIFSKAFCTRLLNTRTKQKKWSGQILQVSGQLASSISTQYDDKKVKIPARPYLKLTDDDFEEILTETEKFLR